MAFWSLASNTSVWRGYDYFKDGKASSYKTVAKEIFECYIDGSAAATYHTVINTIHPRESHCDCPFAEGRRVICKHMVALYFTVYPDEAESFLRAVEESEKVAKREQQEHYKEMMGYVKSLKKEELQRELYSALIELEEKNNRYW